VRLISDDPAFETPGTEAAEAAGGRPDTPEPPPDIMADLEFLRHHWGSAYLIGADGGGYTADRRDGKGATLTAPDPDGLCCKIQADYTADPVSKDLAQDLLRDRP
jgi:hypothetical protein